MNYKTTYLLFGVLVVLLGALATVLVTGPTPSAHVDSIFPSMHAKADPLKADQVTKVVIERKSPDDSNIVFERDDKDWKITEPRELLADTGRVNNLVESLMSAKASREEAPASLKAAGLDTPSRVVTIHGKDREWKLHVGDVTPGGAQSAVAYVTTTDVKKPVAVSKSDLEAALEGVNYFRGKDLLGDKASDARVIRVTEGKKTVELKKDKDRWTMVQPPYGHVDGAEIVTKLSDLRIDHRNDKESDFVKDGVEPAKLAEYNLDPAKGEVLRIAVTRGEGDKAKTVTVVVGLKEIKDQKKYYAALDEGKTRDVVKVTADSVKPFVDLVNDPGKLRSKSLLALESFKQPDAIDVTNSYGTLEFRKPDATKPWELYRGTTSNAVDENDVKQLIDALSKKDVVNSFEEEGKRKELGLEKPDIVVKVWADSLDKPDPKKPGKPTLKKGSEKPATVLNFGHKVRGMVAVERVWDGDKAIGLVPESLLDQVRKGPLAYLDKSLPKFNTGGRADQDVTKVEITQGGQVIEVTRATEKDPWKFTKPADWKDRKVSGSAIGNILDDLNTLRAEEIVSEKPDPKELGSAFDLAKPPVRVVVTMTKDKKDTTHAFDLGKEAAKGVYLKLGGKEAVYVVGNSVLAAIKRDLRDPTLFSFEADKATSVTVKGWEKVFGSVHTLSFEKKGDAWTVKSPPGYNLDPNKVTTLIREIALLHAEKFGVAGKGMTLAAGALEIEIGLPDKKTAKLTVGEAEGGSFVATTDTLKNEAVLIPKGSFEEVKKAPVYFRKP